MDEQKIKTLNLLPLNSKMKEFLLDLFPEWKRFMQDYDYVRFFQGSPNFYTKEYLEQHTLDELLEAFSKRSSDNEPER